MPMIAAALSSPVGAITVVSAEARNENGMLTTCATAPKTSDTSTRIPRITQNRPRESRHERPSAAPSDVCSTIRTAGTSRSFTASQRLRGMAARITRIPRMTAAAGTATASTAIRPPTMITITPIASERRIV